MTMNEQFQRKNNDQAEFIRLMEAQQRWTIAMAQDWLERKPWTYGSIDSADYMQAAFRLSAEFVDAMLDLLEGPIPFMEQLSYEYLISNYACDGVCPELWEKFPDPEEVPSGTE